MSEHLPGLDGLRALAVIAVLIFHDDRLSGGFLGVDLFFAISGFLITTLLLRELRSDDGIDLLGFWGRRLRRLLPAVMVLLITVVIVLRIFGEAGEWIVARQDAPWSQFYVANWHQVAEGLGYWDSFAAPSAFEHLWSLAIEEQFYLVWPVLVLLLWRFGRDRAVLIGTIVGFVASALAMVIVFDGGDPTRVYMGTDTRAFSLLGGALFALPVARDALARLSPSIRTLVGTGLLGIMVTSWFIVDGSNDWLFEGGLIAHNLLAATMIALVSTVAGATTRVLSWPPLEWIGRLSYSLYLWHWPVFIFCSPSRFDLASWQLTLVRFAVTLVLSVISYHGVEQMVRTRATWAHKGRGRVAFVASTFALVAVWVLLPVPNSTNATSADALANAVIAPASTTTIQNPGSNENLVTTTTTLPTDPVRNVYYFGDSIAYDMWPAIETALVAAGLSAESGAFGGVGLVGKDDVEPIENLITVVDTTRPDLIVVQLSVWDALQNDDVQREALNSLRDLASTRDQRVLLLSFPSLAPERIDAGQARLERNAAEMAAALPTLITYLDQREALGPVFDIDIDDDGVPERKRDGIHVCPTGALRSAQWLLRQLETLYGVSEPTSQYWGISTWSTDARYDSPPGACAAL